MNLREMRATVRQIKHRKPRPKMCPSCKGYHIYPQSILGILPTTYVCRDCGYMGPVTVEIDVDEEEPSDLEHDKQ